MARPERPAQGIYSLNHADKLSSVFGTSHPTAFITGSGSKRVGRFIAEHLAMRGYNVAIHSHHESRDAVSLAESIQAMGRKSIVVSGPVQNTSCVEQWIEAIYQKFSRLDLVVNCAAVWEPKSLETTTADDVRFHFEANVLGSFLVSQIAGLRMVAQSHGGAIVLIGDWAIDQPYRDFAAYFVSKGTIPTMTKSLAVELAGRNPRIRVNAIAPGPILYADGVSEEVKESILQQSLLKRHGSANDLVDGLVFLAESPFVTGVVLPIDGGRSLGTAAKSDSPAHPRWKMN